jgi:hypothetical protein
MWMNANPEGTGKFETFCYIRDHIFANVMDTLHKGKGENALELLGLGAYHGLGHCV